MIIDMKCPSCGLVKEDVLCKSPELAPPCEKCGSKMERLWTLRAPEEGKPANHSSLRFHFNWMEP